MYSIDKRLLSHFVKAKQSTLNNLELCSGNIFLTITLPTVRIDNHFMDTLDMVTYNEAESGSCQ